MQTRTKPVLALQPPTTMRLGFALVAMLVSVSAAAEDIPPMMAAGNVSDNSGWIVSIGGMALYEPQYTGAKKFGVSGTPFFSFRRPNEKQDFSSPDDSLDYTLYSTDQLRFGLVGNLRQGRSTQNDNRLAGLSNYPWVIETGFFTELWPVPDVVRTRLEVRHGLKENDGFTMDFSVDGIRKLGAFTISGGPRLSMVDNTIMSQQFGVTALEAFQNGRVRPYRPTGGFRSVGVALSVDYDWSATWQTTFYQRFDPLVRDAATSPVTR